MEDVGSFSTLNSSRRNEEVKIDDEQDLHTFFFDDNEEPKDPLMGLSERKLTNIQLNLHAKTKTS